MDIATQKKQIRQSMKERTDRLTEKDRQAESRSVCRRVLENLPESARVICAYYPMPTEVDIIPLLEQLLERGCDIYLPRTEGKSFLFRQVQSLEDLVPGPFGILEPDADAAELELEDTEYALIPGIAFDHEGNRLGRGNGGYDKWINALKSSTDIAETWGLCFDCQLVNGIPMEAHDEKVDALVTPRELKRFAH